MNAIIRPYSRLPSPSNSSGVACSMSSYLPSLLVQNPFNNCLAACWGLSSRAYIAIFSNLDSRVPSSHSSYPNVLNNSNIEATVYSRGTSFGQNRGFVGSNLSEQVLSAQAKQLYLIVRSLVILNSPKLGSHQKLEGIINQRNPLLSPTQSMPGIARQCYPYPLLEILVIRLLAHVVL